MNYPRSVFPLRRRLDDRPTDWQFYTRGRPTRYTCAIDESDSGIASGRLGGTSRPVGRSGADSLEGTLP